MTSTYYFCNKNVYISQVFSPSFQEQGMKYGLVYVRTIISQLRLQERACLQEKPVNICTILFSFQGKRSSICDYFCSGVLFYRTTRALRRWTQRGKAEGAGGGAGSRGAADATPGPRIRAGCGGPRETKEGAEANPPWPGFGPREVFPDGDRDGRFEPFPLGAPFCCPPSQRATQGHPCFSAEPAGAPVGV